MQDYYASYCLYIGAVALSVAFAWLAHALPLRAGGHRTIHPVPWTLSLLTLWFVMGFRLEIGVDYSSYRNIYQTVADLGFFGYYEAGFWNEPGYILLLLLVHLVYGDFTGVFVCTSLIGLSLFYRAFAFEANRIHPAWCVFVFATTQYFYYFGIDRLFLAVAICTYGLRFIILGEKRKYCLTALVAACFHVSALFMLSLPFICGYRTSSVDPQGRSSRTVLPKLEMDRYAILICLTPILFYALTQVVPYLPAKYHHYGENAGQSASVLSVVLKVPVAILILATLRRTTSYYPPSIIYGTMYLTSLLIQAYSGLAGVGRLCWYFWISLCFSFPFIIKASSRDRLLNRCVIASVIAYCVGYLFYAYLSMDAARWESMFPYRNVFFDL